MCVIWLGFKLKNGCQKRLITMIFNYVLKIYAHDVMFNCLHVMVVGRRAS